MCHAKIKIRAGRSHKWSDHAVSRRPPKQKISIHAPHEGSDHCGAAGPVYFYGISTHAPREGSDTPSRKTASAHPPNFNPRSQRWKRLGNQALAVFSPQFQSTLPVGGATAALRSAVMPDKISTNAPREGSDRNGTAPKCGHTRFQPTLLVRGSDGIQLKGDLPRVHVISTHAPREGSDLIVTPSAHK